MDGVIKAEWNPLRKVVMHRPGIEMFLGLLEPYGSLYERAFSRDGARKEHEAVERILVHEFGVEVLLLKDLILDAAVKRRRIRDELISLARENLEYGGDDAMVKRAKTEFEKNIPYLDTQHFF